MKVSPSIRKRCAMPNCSAQGIIFICENPKHKQRQGSVVTYGEN